MAIIEGEPLALPSGVDGPAENPLGVFARPRNPTGLKGWLTTVDHKKIGIMYGVASMFFLILGGVAALLIRVQLAVPNNSFLSADAYNRIFTMHGTIMVFLVVMPMGAAFANFLMPLQVGARDVAFPRINAFSFWVFLFGGLMLNTSWFLG
ncbi:MAG: cytochrome c oxidase subunit 1, partial [Acidimicrobiales bacterium]